MNELDFTIKEAVNEPIKGYRPGSSEKASLKAKLEELKSNALNDRGFPDSTKLNRKKIIILKLYLIIYH